MKKELETRIKIAWRGCYLLVSEVGIQVKFENFFLHKNVGIVCSTDADLWESDVDYHLHQSKKVNIHVNENGGKNFSHKTGEI